MRMWGLDELSDKFLGITMALVMAAMSIMVFLIFRKDMRFSILTAILLANQIALIVSLRDYNMNSAWIHSMDSPASNVLPIEYASQVCWCR